VRALPVTRTFPWRETRDPWRVLVAEVCCQQTQAHRAVSAYERCCARFPTPSECAGAPLRDVLEAWSGLGYYRRARDLRLTARAIVERHDGRVPDDLGALLALPGVGPYTARAVLAFAFERDVAVVDTNVARVLARAVVGRPLSRTEAQRVADRLVPRGRGWVHNQALLDLGATTCTVRPACERCALRPGCAWRAGGVAADPARRSAHAPRRQQPFAGSDREGRGRLLAAVLRGPVPIDELGAVSGWSTDSARARRVADDLVVDGLATFAVGTLRAAE